MNILIPCKNKREYDILSEKFKGIDDVTIQIYDEEKICGFRYDYVLIGNNFNGEEMRNCLLPLIRANYKIDKNEATIQRII